MAVAVPSEILACFNKAICISNNKISYSYGGGHNSSFEPSVGNRGIIGYDCSSAASAVLHAGRILEHPSGPLGTHELEHWGYDGKGEFLTLWVINQPEIEHCFLEFSILTHLNKKFFQAAHTGTIVGWFPYMNTDGYMPRRRK